MSWIQTYGGRQFFPLAPRMDDIDVRDIAHSLALLCRFNGHCRTFYSVAQHSVLVSHNVPKLLALWGLLHDAAEAYVSDLPRPIKQLVPAFGEAEDVLLEVIMQRFGQAWPMPPEVKHADDVLLATELRDLMNPVPQPWPLRAQPLAAPIVPLEWAAARALFLDRFAELTA